MVIRMPRKSLTDHFDHISAYNVTLAILSNVLEFYFDGQFIHQINLNFTVQTGTHTITAELYFISYT